MDAEIDTTEGSKTAAVQTQDGAPLQGPLQEEEQRRAR